MITKISDSVFLQLRELVASHRESAGPNFSGRCAAQPRNAGVSTTWIGLWKRESQTAPPNWLEPTSN